MVKQTAHKKRSIIIGGVIIGALLVAGAVYFLYSKNQSTSDKKNTDGDSTVYLAENQIEFSQRDYLNLSAEFKKLADAGQRDKAFRLLSSRYEVEKNTDKKVKMILQESSVLGENGFTDEAIDAALRADKIKSSTSTLMQVAMAYSLKEDTGRQVEYIKKAIVAIDTDASIDTELKANMKAGYQRSIEAIESGAGK